MRKIFALATATALAACAQGPEPITDYNAPYLSGKGSPVVAPVRPEPRPVAQRRWLACPNSAQSDDCGNGEIDRAPEKNHQPTTGGGPINVFPELERPEPTPTPEPEPEAPAPEPEPPAPEPEPEPEPPETHEPPPPQECPA